MFINKSFLLGAAFVLLSTNGFAATITGTGDPVTNPFLTGGTMETFDSGPAGESATVALGNVTYQGINGTFTIGNTYIGEYNTRGVYSIYNGGDGIPANFRFDFATPVQAFGFNWGAADVTWLLSAYDSNDVLLESFEVTPTAASNAGEYFGIAALNIAYATLVSQDVEASDWVFIDNFTTAGDAIPVGPAVPVPAMSQLMLIFMTMLLAAFGYLRLRRKV
jgi:hypothetical protein